MLCILGCSLAKRVIGRFLYLISINFLTNILEANTMYSWEKYIYYTRDQYCFKIPDSNEIDHAYLFYPGLWLTRTRYTREAGWGWKRLRRREVNGAKTWFCSRLSSLLRGSTYKRGRPIPRQSILGVWSQPVGDVQNRMFLWNISGLLSG